MTATAVVRVSCDYQGCLAYCETRTSDATAATVRLAAIDAGWVYREGDDYCPTHRKAAS